MSDALKWVVVGGGLLLGLGATINAKRQKKLRLKAEADHAQHHESERED